jgi:hypothetical protein
MSRKDELIKQLEEADRKAELISKLEASDKPSVSLSPEAGDMARDIKEGFETYVEKPAKAVGGFISEQLERPAAAMRSGISTMANRGVPIDAAANAVRGFVKPSEAPTASETLEDIGVPKPIAQNPVASMAADVVMDPFLFTGVAKKAASKLGQVSGLTRTAAERNYGKIKSFAGHSDDAIKRLEQNKDVMKLVLTERDVDSNLRRPNELKKILTGKQLGFTDEIPEAAESLRWIDAGDYIRGGKIGEEAKAVDELVSKASRQLQTRGINLRDTGIGDILVPPKLQDYNVPGLGVDEATFDRVRNIADKYLGTLKNKQFVTLEDIHQFKKNLGTRLSNKDFLKSTDPGVALEKEVLTEMYIKAKGFVANNADKAGLGQEINFRNAKMQAYYTLDNVLTKPASRQVQLTSQGFPLKDAAMAVGGPVAGAAFGSQLFGYGGKLTGAAGGALGARMTSANRANVADYLKYTLPPNAGQKAIMTEMTGRQAFPFGEDSQSRSPDAVMEKARNYNFQRVKSMMTQPLPRSSDELLNNKAAKELLIAKSYHMVGPEAAQILERQFEMFPPQQMKPVLQKFMTDNPSLFEGDEYNRVDGVIMDDMMKQKAISELSKRKDISAIQRARMTDAIINNKRNVVWPKSAQ